MFTLKKDNITVLPVVHYNMEFAVLARQAFLELQPDCVAVEFAQTMELQLLHAASRLPDLSVAIAYSQQNEPIYYLAEPCDAGFEGGG